VLVADVVVLATGGFAASKELLQVGGGHNKGDTVGSSRLRWLGDHVQSVMP
jgi:hypothetical protein